MSDIIRLHGDHNSEIQRHMEIQRLLPWYAAGTLEVAENARIDAHLQSCAECQAELELDRRLQGAISDLPPEVERGWAAMRQAMANDLAAPEQQPCHPRKTPAAGLLAAFNRPLKLGWFVGAQAAFAAIALAFLSQPGISDLQRPGQYRLLSSPRAAAPGNVIVIFNANAREGSVRAALLANGARVVDGPTSAGAYILAIPAHRDLGLVRLRATPAVTLAQPLDADNAQ